MSFNWKPGQRRSLIAFLVQRDGKDCWWCSSAIEFGAPLHDNFSVTIDHVVPTSRGGTNHVDNLRLAHRFCNQKRGSSTEGVARRLKK